MRLSLLSNDYLLKIDSITRLLITNTESRHVALGYLAEHPLQENPFPEHDPLRGDPLQTVIQRWKSKHSSWATSHVRLFEHLYKLGVDPTRDVLFLNGMDIKPEAVDGIPTGRYCLDRDQHAYDPPQPCEKMNTDVSGLSALQSSSVMLNRLRQWRTRFGIHNRELGDPERDFISKFETMMTPVQGLYDRLDAGALFHDPTYTDNCLETLLNIHQRVSLTLMARESQTFIAIGSSSYRGCNIQMSDLEFLSADEVRKLIKRQCPR
jgi:hypothetical protein